MQSPSKFPKSSSNPASLDIQFIFSSARLETSFSPRSILLYKEARSYFKSSISLVFSSETRLRTANLASNIKYSS
jgi:hypothetical protein